MRRASTCLALLGLAVLGIQGVAQAAPTVTFKEKAIPIPGYPHTGNILGAGAAAQLEWTIHGTEYDNGHPAPLIGVNVVEPNGTKLNAKGFTTCPLSTLEKIGGKGCPKASKLTLAGEAVGVVVFGSEPVPEKTTIEGFFAPGGGLSFFTQGTSPAAFEFISKSHITYSAAPTVFTEVPLVETVPGAADASVELINVKAGAAYKKNGKPVYYGTVPKKCPKGGFPIKSELTFAGLAGLSQTVVTNIYKAPCPRK
jgi:hypothetical protein